MTTDTSEKGLESLIVAAMTGRASVAPPQKGEAGDPFADFGGAGWILGDSQDYNREYAIDLTQLREFVQATQEALVEVGREEQDEQDDDHADVEEACEVGAETIHEQGQGKRSGNRDGKGPPVDRPDAAVLVGPPPRGPAP